MRQGDRIQSGHQHNFFMIPNEMIDSHIENMTALGFVVYSVLMRHADAGSQCFPSYSTLERKSALSRPTIAKCIEHLVTKGYIRKLEIGHSKGHATTYQLLDLSLVPTSKGDLLVNEVNQPMSLTSKGDLLVTSKGDLPQLVNEVNSNKTHVTKHINNKTHIKKESDFFENSFSEQKTGNLSDLSKPEDPKTPPIAPPAPQNLKFVDPYQRAMDVRQREPEVKKMMDDREFLKFLIPLMKRWDAYKTSCDSSDARKWVRVAIEPKNDKCDSRWDESRDRYQDFLESQTHRSQQQPAPIAVQEPEIIAPIPSMAREYAAKLARKAS